MKIKDIQEIVKSHINVSKEDIKEIYESGCRTQLRFIDLCKKNKGELHKKENSRISFEWWMPDEKWPKSKSVTSNVNKHGFRSDDFDDSEEGFIFLGCSLTEGYGLEEHETWPWIVGEYFGVKVWNLAQGGQGDDVCFINALKWIPKLNPNAVCMLIPPYGRFNYVDTDQKEHHYSYNLNNLRNPKFPWLFDDKNIYLSMLKNILGIKSICDEYDIPFISQSYNHKMYEESMWKQRARDKQHPGTPYQREVSEYFINEIEGKNNGIR